MRLFLDTADSDEIRQAVRWGVCDGVTTNPTLFAKVSDRAGSYKERVQEIAAIVDGPVSAECVSRSADELVAEAREIASWHPNVVVKIPLDAAGLEAIHRVSGEGIRVNTTLIFSANQALLAANAGAAYVSPFIGRLDDIGQDGVTLVAEIVEMLDRYHSPAQVIAASVRHVGPRQRLRRRGGAHRDAALPGAEGHAPASADRQGHRLLPGRLGSGAGAAAGARRVAGGSLSGDRAAA